MNTTLIFKAILKSPKFRGLVSYLSVDNFENIVDKELWKILLGITKQYNEVPSEEMFRLVVMKLVEGSKIEFDVRNRLDEIMSYQLSDVDEALLFDLIEQNFVRLKVLELGKRLGNILDDKQIDKSKILSYLQNSVYQLNKGFLSTNDGNKEILDNSSIIERIYQKVLDEDMGLLSLFIPSLDQVLDGGIRRGTLSVVLGATSVGKTMFLVYLSAVARIQGLKVLYLSLEDTDKVVKDRFDNLFFGGRVYVDYVMKKKEFLDRFGGGIWVEYNFAVDLQRVKSYIQNYKEKLGGFDVLVVDYGDLILPSHRTGDEFVDQGAIFEELMHIAETEDLYVITASQATRAALSARNITLQHIGRSFRKVQVAHYVIALAQNAEEEEKGVIRIVILKNKFGPRGITVSCNVVRSRHWFREIHS